MNNSIEEELIYQYILREYARVLSVLTPLAQVGINESSLMKRLSEQMRLLKKNITARLEIGIIRAWGGSNKATFAIMDKKFANIDLPDSIRKIVYDSNEAALKTFIDRTKGGMNLSDRVWEQSKEARKIIKKGLVEGIKNGDSAYKMSRGIKDALLEPELPSPAKGVYKSPIKNAMRLVRTEVNAAYRTADQANWNKNPVVLGYKIQVSNTKAKGVKARCELCRMLEGIYPNTFTWSSWHPNCLCIKTPITMTREFLDKYNKLIAKGEDTKENVERLREQAGAINKLPSSVTEYISAGGGRKSWWYQENKKMFGS